MPEHFRIWFETIFNILNMFDKSRDNFFTLIHQSDYRDTYFGKVSGIEIYLKHYRTFQAKYSKASIIKRNLLRRTLAKKSFALSFLLKDRNISVIESLFYGGKGKAYIPSEALYASIATPDAVTLDYFFEALKDSESNYGSYTVGYAPKIPKFDPCEVLYQFGRFVCEILDKQIHVFHKELFANTLISPHKNSFRFTLCDLDVVNAISPITTDQKEYEIQKYRKYMIKRFKNFENKSELVSSFQLGVDSWNP